MKKNWWTSTVIMALIMIITFVYAEFIGFDLKFESLASLGQTKTHFVGLFSRSYDNFDIVLSRKSYSFFYLSKYTSHIKDSYGIFNVITTHLFQLIWAVITVSGVGFIYSLIMCFQTDKYDFYSELSIGIVYLLFSIAVTVLGILVFVGWIYYIKSLHLISIYTNNGIENVVSTYVGPTLIMSLSIISLGSYAWKLTTLLKSE